MLNRWGNNNHVSIDILVMCDDGKEDSRMLAARECGPTLKSVSPPPLMFSVPGLRAHMQHDDDPDFFLLSLSLILSRIILVRKT